MKKSVLSEKKLNFLFLYSIIRVQKTIRDMETKKETEHQKKVNEINKTIAELEKRIDWTKREIINVENMNIEPTLKKSELEDLNNELNGLNGLEQKKKDSIELRGEIIANHRERIFNTL